MINTSYTGINLTLALALQEWCTGDEFVLYRGAFRWFNMANEVMSNHYESMSVEQIAEDFGYEIMYSAYHAAIFKLRVAVSEYKEHYKMEENV